MSCIGCSGFGWNAQREGLENNYTLFYQEYNLLRHKYPALGLRQHFVASPQPGHSAYNQAPLGIHICSKAVRKMQQRLKRSSVELSLSQPVPALPADVHVNVMTQKFVTERTFPVHAGETDKRTDNDNLRSEDGIF